MSAIGSILARRIWSCLARSSLVVVTGCGQSSPQTGGGPIVYAASEIEVVSLRATGATLVAIVPGLQAVEAIESETGKAATIAPPTDAGACFPVAMSVGDIDGDGMQEIAIMDPTCGNWIARPRPDNGWDALPWSSIAPAIVPSPFLAIRDVDADGHADICSASSRGLSVLTKTHGAWNETTLGFGPPTLSTNVRSIFTEVMGGGLFYQRGTFFSLVDIADPSLPTREVTQTVDSATWLKPFSGFDHLTSLASIGCSSFLGIGLAPENAGNAPRQIQLLRYDGSETVRVSDEQVSAMAVQAFSVASHEGTGDALVGLIDGEGPKIARFVLARLSDCGSLTEVASTEFEFDWQTPQSPPGYAMAQLARRGVVIAGVATDHGAQFFHYDGFALRVLSAVGSGDQWQLEFKRLDIHSTRTDHSW